MKFPKNLTALEPSFFYHISIIVFHKQVKMVPTSSLHKFSVEVYTVPFIIFYLTLNPRFKTTSI